MVEFQKFLHSSRHDELPEETIAHARRNLLDLVGVMLAGSKTQLTRMIKDHAVEHFAPGGASASLMLDGRRASPAGAALANDMMIDSVDAHDGYKPAKGHIGCHVLPTLLALFEAEGLSDGQEFLTSLVIGYEIGARASVALHETVSRIITRRGRGER